MKAHKMILFICLMHAFLLGCKDKPPSVQHDGLKFKLYNQTNYNLKEVNVFSNNVNDLVKSGKSVTYDFSWDSTEDIPFISFKIEEEFFGKYIFPDTTKCMNSIFIDSVNVELGEVYLHIE